MSWTSARAEEEKTGPVAFLTASSGRGDVSSAPLLENSEEAILEALAGAFYGIPVGGATVFAVSSRTGKPLASNYLDADDAIEDYDLEVERFALVLKGALLKEEA